ncbi:Hypothetical protein, putative [Bodo saltans]|uniref:Uncharacterized protein n=1 Tax=Bodo saltans TaxID=75058 RepID=A0A0S4JI37_BODSA|nr:Hypothetical protein, putative [Bodo saltans]|eukprot:CUG88909.1 Hypothetical protein, putative [Bodo saltans]
MLRPTAGCSSIVRLCEIPDGCRLLCNGEYLLNAGLLRSDTIQEKNRSTSLIPPANSSASGGSANTITTQPPTTTTGGALPPSSHHLPPPSPRPPPPPYQHRLIGMGCNNQYDWELSLLAMFQGASLSSNHTTHRLGWTTSMDCTLTVEAGKRQWNVPQAMRDAQIGFTGVSLCGGARRLQANELGPNHIKRFQLKTEWDVAAAAAAASRQPSPSLNNKQYVHYSIHPDAVHAATSRGHFTESFEDQRFTMGGNTEENHTLSRLPSQPRWFDALSIFKVDIEGSEWKYIPAWIRGEFYSLQTHAPLSLIRSGSAAAIDFSAYAPDFFTVSLFFLEYHRIGRDDTGATAVGGLRAHWLTLQIYALGFIMIAHEKNEFSQRCFEHAYVHVRHFIRSEMWMLLRDDI